MSPHMTTEMKIVRSKRSPLTSAAIGLGVFAGVIGLGVGAGVAGANYLKAGPPSGAAIATIDLEAAFEKLEERTDLETTLKAQRDRMQERLGQLETEVKEGKTEFDNTPAGPGKLDKGKALRDRMVKAEFEAQFSQKRLDEMRGELRRELYTKISDASGKLAKQSGWAMVITSDQKAEIPMADADTVARAIGFKRMLYVDPALDVTNDIVVYMNNEYRAGGKKK